jgi:hypothetical protein
MKVRVTGHRRDNAARVSLEFDAESKAAAERDAIKQGIEVVRVEILQGGGTYGVGEVLQGGRARSSGGGAKLIVLVLALAAAAGAAYYFWPTIQSLIPGLKK